MKAILVVLLALLSCGFVVLTPKSRRELEKASSQWYKSIASEYDFKALHQFLKECISTNKHIEDLDLSAVDIGTVFSRRDKFAIGAGRWLLVTKDPKSGGFELRALIDSRGWAVFVCERKDKTTFRVVRTYIDSFVQLSPPPYSFSP